MTPFLQPFSQLNDYLFSTPDHQEPKQPNAQSAPTASPLSATTSSPSLTPLPRPRPASRRRNRTKKALHQKDEMLSWFHFSSRPFPVSSKHLTRVTRPRLHTALTHGNPVSRISRSRFTRAASGRTSKTSWFGCSHPLTAVLWKPVLIFYSFRSLPFPVLYSLCKFQIFVKVFLLNPQ